jgi:hypothetical protein
MKKILLASVLVLSFITNAHAEPSALVSAEKSYKVYVRGIHIADLKVNMQEGSLATDIESYGLVKKISKYEDHGKSSFVFKDDKFIPRKYETHFTQRQGNRSVEISYDAKGAITHEQVTPPDKRNKRPAVVEENKKDTVDPLTAVMVARQKIIEGLKNNENSFSFNMYDGRRLARLEFTIVGRETKKIDGKQRNIITVTFKRKALEGFTNNELKRMTKEEPTFSLYLSDDDNMLPVKADVFSELGTAVLME